MRRRMRFIIIHESGGSVRAVMWFNSYTEARRFCDVLNQEAGGGYSVFQHRRVY